MAKTSLSDVRFTEREIRTIRDALDRVRKETRQESPRRLRISNLCDRVLVIIAKAERRTNKLK